MQNFDLTLITFNICSKLFQDGHYDESGTINKQRIFRLLSLPQEVGE
jgi:hypothetical protein